MLFAGIPIWWALGLFQIAFFVLTIPMLVYLLRRRRVLVPDGFGIWLLLLVWVLGGVLVLQVDAPGAIPGASSARYLTFAFRFGWYVCATIALLYVVNTVRALRTERIAFALGCMFVALVGGGLLAAVVPELEFATPVEMLVPRSLAANEFIRSLVHAQVAQLQDFLGYVEPRASAPFPYANQWGIAMAATAPHFVVGWWARGGLYRRLVPVIGAVAVLPIVTSLNRGMWAAFAVMVCYGIVRSGLHRRPGVLVAALSLLTLVATAIWLSPLGSLILQRLNTPHSNQARTNLSTLTVQSVLEGSPLLGFGTTRQVQGNFNSIAAGATADCPACSPPPLGTQGNLWELMFGAGVVGLLLYLAFMVYQLLRLGRVATPAAIASQCTLIAVLVTSPVYNLVHPVLVVVMVALGILVRASPRLPERELADMIRPVQRSLAIVLVFAVVGAAMGGALQSARGTSTVAIQRVLVPQIDLLGVPDARPLALDSEALLVTSQQVLDDAAMDSGVSAADLKDRITVTAQPNTQILVIRVSAANSAAASDQVEALTAAYLELRTTLAETGRDIVRARANAELDALAIAIATVNSALAQSSTSNPALLQTSAALQARAREASTDLAALEGDLDAGRPLSAPRVVTPTDPWIVSIGSGLMLGLVVGLCVAWLIDGRSARLHAYARTRSDLPVVDRVPCRSAVVTPRDAGRAAQVVEVYQPLAAVLAAGGSDAARRLAFQLDDALVAPAGRGGTRLLLVTSGGAPAGDLERVRRTAERAGLSPVGVILVDD